MAQQSYSLTSIKHILITLLLSTQLFAYEKNKPITVYGYISEKENNYILNAYHIDGRGVKDTPFQLLFDSDDINFTIPTEKYSKHSKLKGIILDGDYKNKKHMTKQIFKVSSIEKLYGKMKTKSYLNSYTYVKALSESPMLGKVEAEQKATKIDYITNIKVKADNKLLYNVNVNHCLAENPLMKFSFKNINPLSLTLEYTDNNSRIKTNTIKVIKNKQTRQISQSSQLSRNAKSYPNQIESIKNLFGDITLIEDGIQLTAPKLSENGSSIPLRIKSNIKFKSIALFIKAETWKPRYSEFRNYIDCGEKNKFTLVSQWFSTPYSIANFGLRIKLRLGEGEVLVVLESKDGKFYTVRKEVNVIISGKCDGD